MTPGDQQFILTVLINRDFNSYREETDSDGHHSNLINLLRWAGRIIASIAAIWFVVMLIGSAITEGAGPITIETGTLVFLGVIAVIDATLIEIDRAMNDLRFRGVEIYTDVNGKPIDSPEFMPIYEKMAYYDLPILIHPRREAVVPDYEGEKESKYLIWNRLDWPHATSMAMMRLVCSGILEKYPNLKFVTHHAGGAVPYLVTRISLLDNFNEMRMGYRYEQHLSKNIVDYLRMFYNDTAVYGNTPSLMCAYAFCGADHLLFATDMPFDSQTGYRLVRETIRSVEEMDITDAEKKKIFEDNARKLLRLPI